MVNRFLCDLAGHLAGHTDLWRSFLFTKAIYPHDKNSLGFVGMVAILLGMANYLPLPETSLIQLVEYPADTLYVLAENEELSVSKLVERINLFGHL